MEFVKEDLAGRDFSGADLAGARFSNCTLEGASFRHADLTGARPVGNSIGLIPHSEHHRMGSAFQNPPLPSPDPCTSVHMAAYSVAIRNIGES